MQFTVYYDGKGYVGVYCAEDGTIEALDKDKVEGLKVYFDGSGGYGDKLFVQQVTIYSGATARKTIYAYLGIDLT